MIFKAIHRERMLSEGWKKKKPLQTARVLYRRGMAFKKNKNSFFKRESKEAQAHEKQSGVFETLEDAVWREGSGQARDMGPCEPCKV